MNRAVRTRLVGLFLEAFRDRRKREALLWLALYCESSGGGRRGAVATDDLDRAWVRRYPDRESPGVAVAECPADLEDLLTYRGSHGPSREDRTATRVPDCARGTFEPRAEFAPFLHAACHRIRVYAEVAERVAARENNLAPVEPLRRAVAEATLCFNAGLYFEAHELLEHHWVGLPKGPAKRFLQGLIQISVGFHHAARGSYTGAANQLEKGLAKLAEPHDDSMGLDHARFLREVTAARRRIVDRGLRGMRAAAPDEIPQMHLSR
jgi:uncharacterized protein